MELYQTFLDINFFKQLFTNFEDAIHEDQNISIQIKKTQIAGSAILSTHEILRWTNLIDKMNCELWLTDQTKAHCC